MINRLKKGAFMKNLLAGLFIMAAVAVPSFSQCCLSDYEQWFADTAAQMGVTNINVAHRDCDTMAATGTFQSNNVLLTGQTINSGDDLRITVYLVMGPIVTPVMSDTVVDWCLIVDLETAALLPAYTPLKSFPNPFRSLLTVHFGNPSGRANLEMVDLSGRVVCRMEGIYGNQAALSLKGLKQGMYIVRVTTRESVRTLRVVHVK
jgi:hypothetical protein